MATREAGGLRRRPSSFEKPTLLCGMAAFLLRARSPKALRNNGHKVGSVAARISMGGYWVGRQDLCTDGRRRCHRRLGKTAAVRARLYLMHIAQLAGHGSFFGNATLALRAICSFSFHSVSNIRAVTVRTRGEPLYCTCGGKMLSNACYASHVGRILLWNEKQKDYMYISYKIY